MELTEAQWVAYMQDVMSKLPAQGTLKYTRALHRIYNYCMIQNKCPRPDDLCITLVCKYIANYQEMYKIKHGEEMKAEKIFAIRLPWWLRDKAYKI